MYQVKKKATEKEKREMRKVVEKLSRVTLQIFTALAQNGSLLH